MWTLTFPPFLDAQSKFVTLQPKTCIFSDRSRYLRSYKKSTIYILRYTYIFIFTDICLMGVFYLIFLDSRRRMVSLTPTISAVYVYLSPLFIWAISWSLTLVSTLLTWALMPENCQVNVWRSFISQSLSTSTLGYTLHYVYVPPNVSLSGIP